jgi:hypothetical protein
MIPQNVLGHPQLLLMPSRVAVVCKLLVRTRLAGQRGKANISISSDRPRRPPRGRSCESARARQLKPSPPGQSRFLLQSALQDHAVPPGGLNRPSPALKSSLRPLLCYVHGCVLQPQRAAPFPAKDKVAKDGVFETNSLNLQNQAIKVKVPAYDHVSLESGHLEALILIAHLILFCKESPI